MQSNNSELIVLLDHDGEPIGSAPKLASHHSDTPLHLAFSTYIFNDIGELLVTRRADSKKVWNGVWTNSCCGHPAPDEAMNDAISRRVKYEIGMEVSDLKLIVPDYRYTTPPHNGIIENEVCPIYFARSNQVPQPNSEEVSDYEWMSWKAYTKRLTSDTKDLWSWWCKDQLKRLVDMPEIIDYIVKK